MRRRDKDIAVTEDAVPEPTLSKIPMYTTDGVEIKINSIIYTISWSSGYEFKKEGKAEIEAMRVFHVSNTHRVYRARCILGCETVFKIAGGCPSTRLYGKLHNAQVAIRKMILEDLKKCTQKMDGVQKTLAHIESEENRISLLTESKIAMPKEVRV